ncbi:MAG TPA: LytTR family DNA-binding domain-containing protein [Burkholderiaceae bacterium]|nr:LytTR family DNA-binding domain-containing protein [Burkholderiaceae bacterium]
MTSLDPPPAVLAEDEPLLAQALQADLARLWPALRIVAAVADGLQAAEQALQQRPDVCFFDIRMPGQSGLEAAQALVEDWPEGTAFPLLVFITAYDQYAVQAFQAQAVDYLLKPVDEARLAACVARLQARLAERRGATQALAHTVEQLRALLGSGAASPAVSQLAVIQASVGNTVHMLPVEDVQYFEAADKYVRVITAEREYLIRTSLRELLPQLDPQRFWQIHRGTVVQARAVRTATRDESGKAFLTLHARPERLVASRLYAHLFKGM